MKCSDLRELEFRFKLVSASAQCSQLDGLLREAQFYLWLLIIFITEFIIFFCWHKWRSAQTFPVLQ